MEGYKKTTPEQELLEQITKIKIIKQRKKVKI